MSTDTTFSAARADVLERYEGAIASTGAALLCIVTDSACSASCLEAIEKTADALGYGAANVARVLVDADGQPLDGAKLFEVVEGLDPVCICAVGAAGVQMFAQAYEIQPQPFTRTTALGRPVCLMADLAQLMDSDQGRQKAWSLLKTLPVFPV